MLDDHKLSLFSTLHSELQDQTLLQAFISDSYEVQPSTAAPILTSEVKGLDKLVEQGFNHDEIRALRFHFHAMCILKYEDYNAKSEPFRISYEERWLNGQIADFNLSPEETEQFELQLVRNMLDTAQWHRDGLRVGICVWCAAECVFTTSPPALGSQHQAAKRPLDGSDLQSISLRTYSLFAELVPS